MILAQQIFFSTIALSFALIHFLLYNFRKEQKSRLFFAILMLLYALNVLLDFENFKNGGDLLYLRLHRLVMPFITPVMLVFLYTEFKQKFTKQFYILSAIILILTPFAVIDPTNKFKYIQIVNIFFFVEISRVLFWAYKTEIQGAKIISSAFAIFGLFSLYDVFNDVGIIQEIANIKNAHIFGFLSMIIIITYHLAYEYSVMNDKMEESSIREKLALFEKEILNNENIRKSEELDEARRIQIAMLPQCENNLLNYDICFDMVPAVEVGGDYYDYFIKNDNTLILLIGDATGHGTRAGMMTAIIKSIVLCNLHNFRISEFFNSASAIIKKMNLNKLYMSLMIVENESNILKVSSAGMPGLMIYRHSESKVETIITKGMPLGAFDNFPYQIKTTSIEKGDVVVMMSDGLAELFNENMEQFGYERIQNIIFNNHNLNPSQINNVLFDEARKWKKSDKFDDDISFIVFKINERK